MKNINFEKAEFICSTLDKSSFPLLKNERGLPYPEIVIAGKSNVGKSSLINHLLNQKKLAYVSSKPGKTKTINFFKVDNRVILLDFPGYGFAIQSIQLKEEWAKNFDVFLNSRPSIKLLLLLADIRRSLGKEDITFYKWAQSKNIPCFIILTKSDKQTKDQIEKKCQAINQHLVSLSFSSPLVCLPYSINEPTGKKILLSQIQDLLGDN